MWSDVFEKRPVRGINVSINCHVSHEVIEQLVDLAITQRGASCRLLVACAGLPDRVGVKIAHLIAISETISECCLTNNNFTLVTVLAIAQALKSNKSLRKLTLFDNRCCMYAPMVREAFLRALYINPNRCMLSEWKLTPYVDYITYDNYVKEKYVPNEHPSLQELLLGHLHRPISVIRWRWQGANEFLWASSGELVIH